MASSHFIIFLLFALASNHVASDVVLEEDAYTVTTVLDGYKLNINPRSLLPRYGSSDLIVLDSSGKAFYTVSFPISQESVIKRFSGSGTEGYSDGDSASAMFKMPRSFAVDSKGNVYVADKHNGTTVIRKISKSGVTTIAGGHSLKPGHVDGPAQNASFSADIDLVFVPEQCALLISDHGNRLIRQINLKADDCARGSQSALGAASIWIGLVVSCLLGSIIGFVARPCIAPCTGRLQPHLSQRDMEALPNQSGETNTDTLLRLQKHSQVPRMEYVSLLDSDDLCSCEIKQSKMSTNQLEDLISIDGSLELSDDHRPIEGDQNQERSNVSSESCGRIDNMIQANIMGFADSAYKTVPLEGSLLGNSGLVKRR